MSQRALSVSRMTGNRSTFAQWYQAVVREADMAEPSRRGVLQGGLAIGTLALGGRAAFAQHAGHAMPEIGVAPVPGSIETNAAAGSSWR